MSSPKHALPGVLLAIAASVFLFLDAWQLTAAQVTFQASSDNVWTRVGETSFEIDTLKLRPGAFQAFNLNAAKLNDVLRTAPRRFTADAQARTVILTLPLPTGNFGLFKIEEAPIIAPKLAERFPWLKAYAATGLDDRSATARFEVTPQGLTAMVSSATGTFFIDPGSKTNSHLYISYFKISLPPDPSGFLCNGTVTRPIRPRALPEPKPRRHHALPVAGDSDFRFYRLAVAASSEYVAAIHQGDPNGDPLIQALIAIHRTIDRVNEIYERDLGISFELVGDEASLIYTSPVNDPYVAPTNTDDFFLANEENLDDKLGWDNYDVGHLFLAHGGGVASQPCACNYWYKADGLTGRRNPQGDAFDVDYVAHELGHQFGASHSFNGTTAGCRFRNADTAYEPGSGSTIMGYPGIGVSGNPICGAENVQNFSDGYFHAISLRELNLFITSTSPQMGDTCSQRVPTNNFARPFVVGPGDFFIPKETPFTLTIKNSGDNDGDRLVYNWEEFDLGDPDPPRLGDPLDADKIRPLFRSRGWPGFSRTFPQLTDLLKPPAGTYTAESLPTNNRTMRFRATARDSRGRYGYDDSQITVIATRTVRGRLTPSGPVTTRVSFGPFVVTQPSHAASWRKRSRHTVAWDVANTNLAPVSCKYVRISLLMRGDEDHPILLAAKVRNTGSAQVVVPIKTPLGDARVKVEAFGNIFFNLAKADVQIVNR